MNAIALEAKSAGNLKPKAKAQRVNAPAVTKIKSTGTRTASGTSVPLSSLPNYDKIKRRVELDNYNAAMARSAASRGTSNLSNAPSDREGCHVCGGPHYARDCTARSPRGPYGRR